MKGIVKNDRSPHARRLAIGLDSVKLAICPQRRASTRGESEMSVWLPYV
jgi:hypothetical protein